jgi:hypothetical protein
MTLTKSHKTAQRPVYKPLSPEQENAIDLLILGQPDREVEEHVGPSHETVWQWRHHYPVFISEPTHRRQALWAEAHEHLRALVEKSIEVLERVVQGGDVKATVGVLKAVKLYGQYTEQSRRSRARALAAG